MNTNQATLARLQGIMDRLESTKDRNPGVVRMDRLELDWLLTVAQAAVGELESQAGYAVLAAANKAEAGSQPIRVVQKDNGVDGHPILGYVTEAELPLHEAFIAGYNVANKYMTGDLEIVELAPFDITSLD